MMNIVNLHEVDKMFVNLNDSLQASNTEHNNVVRRIKSDGQTARK